MFYAVQFCLLRNQLRTYLLLVLLANATVNNADPCSATRSVKSQKPKFWVLIANKIEH